MCHLLFVLAVKWDWKANVFVITNEGVIAQESAQSKNCIEHAKAINHTDSGIAIVSRFRIFLVRYTQRLKDSSATQYPKSNFMHVELEEYVRIHFLFRACLKSEIFRLVTQPNLSIYRNYQKWHWKKSRCHPKILNCYFFSVKLPMKFLLVSNCSEYFT